MLFFSGIAIRYMTFYYKHLLMELVVELFANGDNPERSLIPRRSAVTTTLPRHKADDEARKSAILLLAKKYSHRTSSSFAYKVMIALLVPGICCSILISSFICPSIGLIDYCDEEKFYNVGVVFLAVGLVSYIVSYLILKRRTRQHPDPFGLLNELLVDILVGMVLLIPTFVIVATGPTPVNEKEVLVDKDLYHDVPFLFHFVYLVPYQVFIAARSPEDKYNLSLKDIVEHPLGKQLFKQHLISEYSFPNLMFWQTARDWKAAFDETSQEVREKVAKNLFGKYFSTDSPTEINVSAAQKNLARQALESGEKLEITLFDGLLEEIFVLMESDSFYRFKIKGVYHLFMGLSDADDSTTIEELEAFTGLKST